VHQLVNKRLCIPNCYLNVTVKQLSILCEAIGTVSPNRDTQRPRILFSVTRNLTWITSSLLTEAASWSQNR